MPKEDRVVFQVSDMHNTGCTNQSGADSLPARIETWVEVYVYIVIYTLYIYTHTKKKNTTHQHTCVCVYIYTCIYRAYIHMYI